MARLYRVLAACCAVFSAVAALGAVAWLLMGYNAGRVAAAPLVVPLDQCFFACGSPTATATPAPVTSTNSSCVGFWADECIAWSIVTDTVYFGSLDVLTLTFPNQTGNSTYCSMVASQPYRGDCSWGTSPESGPDPLSFPWSDPLFMAGTVEKPCGAAGCTNTFWSGHRVKYQLAANIAVGLSVTYRFCGAFTNGQVDLQSVHNYVQHQLGVDGDCVFGEVDPIQQSYPVSQVWVNVAQDDLAVGVLATYFVGNDFVCGLDVPGLDALVTEDPYDDGVEKYDDGSYSFYSPSVYSESLEMMVFYYMPVTGVIQFMGSSYAVPDWWFYRDLGDDVGALPGVYTATHVPLVDARFRVCYDFGFGSLLNTVIVSAVVPITNGGWSPWGGWLPTITQTNPISFDVSDGPCLQLGPVSTSGGVFSDVIPIDWAGVELCLKYYNIHSIEVKALGFSLDFWPYLLLILNAIGGLLILQTIRKR